MCDSRIKPECTGGKENKLGDGRTVCNVCLSYVTSGQPAKPAHLSYSSQAEEQDFGDRFATTK